MRGSDERREVPVESYRITEEEKIQEMNFQDNRGKDNKDDHPKKKTGYPQEQSIGFDAMR